MSDTPTPRTAEFLEAWEGSPTVGACVQKITELERELAAANAETERAKSDRNAIACRVRSELLEKLAAANARIAMLETDLRNETLAKQTFLETAAKSDAGWTVARVEIAGLEERIATLSANQCEAEPAKFAVQTSQLSDDISDDTFANYEDALTFVERDHDRVVKLFRKARA